MGYRVFVRSLFWGCMLYNVFGCSSLLKAMASSKITLPSDASQVTWAHAVNSQEELKKELAGPADFLEADVSMGLLTGNEFGTLVPIMAHPPDTSSDISLEMWIDAVIHHNTGKGVKLDFKSLDAVEPSLGILQRRSEKLNFSLWLNADILYGPIHASITPVKDDLFLLLCHQYFPQAVQSVGWTTNWYPSLPQDEWHYEWMYVRKMADVIRCFGYENNYPSFTFPVRGIFASRSIRQLQWLLGVVPESSLTVWSAKDDPLEIADLKLIRQSFPPDKVFYDIPERLQNALSDVRNTFSYVPRTAFDFNADQWMTFTHGQGPQCTSYSYISNNTIVFGKSLSTAVLLKKMLHVDDDNALKVEGRIKFFKDYERRTSSYPGNHELKIVVVDVSLLSKNSTGESLDLTESDADVLWSAVNASELYSFRQTFNNNCHMFQLDTDNARSFQAWNISCHEMNADKPFDEIVKSGVQVVPYRKRLVLPAVPFMIGFVSTGEDHVVIHDFKLSDGKDIQATSDSCALELSLGLLTFILALYVFHKIA
ncbi:Protein FAM151A [Araneus ventricosus]|uniref:Protein FAM151A n=1 Tax=Araneus ventricosus TaxID=182803 RepID=A0A4Y2EAY5_ARAVE|nr:Protein FAM151A [Araneus ventricosus]